MELLFLTCNEIAPKGNACEGMKDCVDLLTMNRLFWKFWKPICGGDLRSRSGQLHQRQCRSSCES